MTAATDPGARRAAIRQLRAFDAQHLPQLRQLQAAMGGRWEIQDAAARDSVLAAIQLEAATDAEGDLLQDSGEVHKRVAKASGMGLEFAWCGMFTVNHYLRSGMDSDLKSGFLHVDNVVDYFTYRYARTERVPKWVWADARWHELRSYHEERGSLRRWTPGEQLWGGGALDILPGDAVLVDHQGDGKPDHIVKVSSYDPATGKLITIGGNDGGFVIDHKGKGNKGESKAKQEKRETAEASLGAGPMTTGKMSGGAAGGHVGLSVHAIGAADGKKGTIFGIGRPSLVDFENHVYDRKHNHAKKPPPALKE